MLAQFGLLGIELSALSFSAGGSSYISTPSLANCWQIIEHVKEICPQDQLYLLSAFKHSKATQTS